MIIWRAVYIVSFYFKVVIFRNIHFSKADATDNNVEMTSQLIYIILPVLFIISNIELKT